MRATCLVLWTMGCRTDPEAPVSSPGSSSSYYVDVLEPSARALLNRSRRLPPRAAAASVADRLLASSDARNPGQGAHATKLAGDIYARLWHVEHIESDAHMAIALLRAATDALAGREPNEACAASLARAELEAELTHDAHALFEEHYAGARLYVGTPCGAVMDEATRLLSTYRATPDRLAALAAQAERRRAAYASAEVQARVVASDEAGVVVAPASVNADGVRLSAIAPYSSTDRARVVITLSGPVKYEIGALAPDIKAGANPQRARPRLFVDMDHVETSAASDLVVGGLVERIQVRKRSTGARLELQLAEPAYRRVFFLPEPFRIVIDVATTPPTTGTVTAAKRPVHRIVLDPGHGGSDPGAIGPSGLKEKDVTLDIAHRAAPVLSRELGIPTLLTRDIDQFVTLEERTARANAFHADLLVSIHCNASDNSLGRGVATFVLDATRDDLAAHVAARENATSLLAAPEVSSIAQGVRRTELTTTSSHLAELLQRAAMASLAPSFRDTVDLGVRTAGFFVLVGAEMPGVLFESSFISNPTEEKRLVAPAYRQKLADAIVNAVRAYREGR